jgi:ribonuclease PH
MENHKNKRIDGRTEGTLRDLSCELSCLHRADGSALWKSGSTHVLASVHGPIAPIYMAKEKSTTLMSLLIKSSDAKESTHEYKTFLTNVLTNCICVENHPRTVIQVVLQIIQTDGSLLSSLLHAAVAALMDAGIDLLYLPVATTCLIPSFSQTILLDPCLAEEQESDNSILILVVNGSSSSSASSSQTKNVLASHTIGAGVSLNRFLSCQQIASKAFSAIPAFWRLAIEQKVTRESQTLWSR